MTLTLSDFTGHADANFRRLATIWDECRTRTVPTRKELSFMKLLPLSAKVVMLDISQAVPTVVYSGSDSLPFFYFDPQGASLMQVFSYETFQPLMKSAPVLKDKKGLFIRIRREGDKPYAILALPISDSTGRVVKVIAAGERVDDEAKEGVYNAVVSNNTEVTWEPVALGR